MLILEPHLNVKKGSLKSLISDKLEKIISNSETEINVDKPFWAVYTKKWDYLKKNQKITSAMLILELYDCSLDFSNVMVTSRSSFIVGAGLALLESFKFDDFSGRKKDAND